MIRTVSNVERKTTLRAGKQGRNSKTTSKCCQSDRGNNVILFPGDAAGLEMAVSGSSVSLVGG
jgi:hypothetical protein